ncbi:MAG: hypothetical protein COT90_05050 [Candidatus Diapherotrites archaeon CG10_big_fil_rev_8_21_14_0_10_31_34]|nr:MAG: hypothetical protein COT90_05050 [Candidatus Diapherotrites archaeon CG10_big_fil_rev_8_21_14_0_10_31_34]
MLDEKIKEEEKTEKKQTKMKELMKLLSHPETTHGIRFDFESETLKKEKKKTNSIKEVKV